jgi:2-polyprenyl-6-hydroxyphenyl methylase/3-demethylubiquinone-9 3-methyltransferase
MFDTLCTVQLERGGPTEGLSIADIGCGPGAQSIYWAARGHEVHGLDVNADFIDVARERAADAGLEVDFRVGTAASLPWADESVDICLAPELLEHVPEWEDCLDEFARILRPGGLLYINTSNKLCPVQNEFELPLYSWYPRRLKRYCEKLAVTSKPQFANYATYPAVNWFTYYELQKEFLGRGMTALDRTDLIHLKAEPGLFHLIAGIVRASSVLRFAVQLVTPYTLAVGVKRSII